MGSHTWWLYFILFYFFWVSQCNCYRLIDPSPSAAGRPPSSSFQPYDEASGGVCVRVCLDPGHQSPCSHARLQPHQRQRRQDAVLLLHLLQRGVARHHHPGRHAPHPDGAGVRGAARHAHLLLRADLQLPAGETDGKTRESEESHASVRRHRGGLHGVFLTHHGDDGRRVGDPLVPPVGLRLLLHLHPAHHRVPGTQLPQLGAGPRHLRFLQLHVQESSLQLAASLPALQRRRREEYGVVRGKSVHHPTGTQVHEGGARQRRFMNNSSNPAQSLCSWIFSIFINFPLFLFIQWLCF